MEKLLLLIAGMPGAGKTRFADYIASQLDMTLIVKDRLKEILWETLHYDTNIRSESQKYGGLAYHLAFHFCEMLMKAGNPMVFESNFTKPCPAVLQNMVRKYGYNVITVLFGGDLPVIHRRFLERDRQEERHPGLVSNNYFADFERFQNATRPCREFDFGDVIIPVDATDFTKVCYGEIKEQILHACSSLQ